MKLLQILPTLSAGGAEGFVANLGVTLAGLGVETRFFLLGGVRGERGELLVARLKSADVTVSGTEQRRIASPLNLLKLGCLIRSWQPDVIQANLYTAEFAIATLSLLCPGLNKKCLRRLANTEFYGARPRLVVDFLAKRFQTNIACSEAVADSFSRIMPQYSDRMVKVIKNGGMLRENPVSNEERIQAKSKLNIPPGAFAVAHIGRIDSTGKNSKLDSGQKAHDVLLKAFAKAFAGDKDVVLIMLGDGPLRHEAESLAESSGIKNQTIFLGNQPEPWTTLMAADMFFFPSRHEGMPNVLPEAASCGLPVVASDIPEISSLAPDNGAWILVDVDNVEAFAEALRNIRINLKNFTGKAISAAPEFRQNFSMETCARKYLEVYNSMLKAKE